MWFKRVRPYTEMFVEWFMNKDLYQDYYWVSPKTFIKSRTIWDVICVYAKIKSRNKRWRAYQRVYVNTFDILRFLNFKWVLKYEEYKKYFKRKSTHDDFWMLKTAKFSEKVRNELTSKLLKEIILIVSKIGTRKDRYITEGFLRLLNPDDKQQVTEYDKQVKRSAWRPRTLSKEEAKEQ